MSATHAHHTAQGLVAEPAATIFLRMVRSSFQFAQLLPPPLHDTLPYCTLPSRSVSHIHTTPTNAPTSSVICPFPPSMSHLTQNLLPHQTNLVPVSAIVHIRPPGKPCYSAPRPSTFRSQPLKLLLQNPTDRLHVPSTAGSAARSQDVTSPTRLHTRPQAPTRTPTTTPA